VQRTQLKHNDTGFFSKTVTDYLSGNESLRPFYKYEPILENFADVIQDKQTNFQHRDVLVKALEEQYTSNGLAIPENVKLLANENAFTVTTGHQLCLFTGPLYFLYKIVSVINLAKKLKAQHSNYEFVPVFWMATEDHDFEEINHINLFGEKVVWEQEKGGAVGRLNTATIANALEQIKAKLGDSEQALQLISLLEKAYTEQRDLASATRYLVSELFAESGLVIVDGDDARLKQLFKPIMQEELLQNGSFEAVNKTNENLSNKYKLQVNPREINLFYLQDGIRERIVMEGGSYKVNNSSIKFSESEILEELEQFPERFSPNVILRPVYQECILPNLAYIGGGGELAYWFQLKGVFDHFKINYPILLLRSSVLWIDKGTAGKMQKLGLKAAELFTETEELVTTFVRQQSTNDTSLQTEAELLKTYYIQLSEKISSIDPSLKQAAIAQQQKALNGIEDLEKRLVKAEKRQQETGVNQLRKLKERLFPNGSLQERHNNFIPFYLKYGSNFVAKLSDQLDPLDFHFTVLSED
jgi:bacillithiol biosynthesis cysteine-adding enzyme BshC